MARGGLGGNEEIDRLPDRYGKQSLDGSGEMIRFSVDKAPARVAALRFTGRGTACPIRPTRAS